MFRQITPTSTPSNQPVNSRSTRFYRHLSMWRERPFEFGKTDCVTFTTSWVDRELGTSFGDRIRSELKYSSHLGALRMISRRGGYQSLVEKFCGEGSAPQHGWETGDVALFINGYHDMTLGLLGEQLVYCPDDDGLSALSVERLVLVWRLSCLKQPPQ